MERQSISSSNIKAAGWEDGKLQVEFGNGVYEYNAPEETYQALISAESVGKYFQANIRKLGGVKIS